MMKKIRLQGIDRELFLLKVEDFSPQPENPEPHAAPAHRCPLPDERVGLFTYTLETRDR
jgi:hypothetical protein